jgi:hypothetical protein
MCRRRCRPRATPVGGVSCQARLAEIGRVEIDVPATTICASASKATPQPGDLCGGLSTTQKALMAAVGELLTRKPHLPFQRLAGDIGKGRPADGRPGCILQSKPAPCRATPISSMAAPQWRRRAE